MIAGRPTNLWLGLASALFGALEITLVAVGADPAIVATVGGAWLSVVGSIIAVVAFQPPTLSPGDSFTVKTAGDAPNYTTVVAHPPAQDAAPVEKVEP